MALLSPARRQRVLQVSFVVAAVAAVLLASRLSTLAGTVVVEPARGHVRSLLVLLGYAVAGWALGMAFRLQFVREVTADRVLRLLLAAPAVLVCLAPVLRAVLPSPLDGLVPLWAISGQLGALRPLFALVAGLAISLGVTGGGRR